MCQRCKICLSPCAQRENQQVMPHPPPRPHLHISACDVCPERSHVLSGSGKRWSDAHAGREVKPRERSGAGTRCTAHGRLEPRRASTARGGMLVGSFMGRELDEKHGGQETPLANQRETYTSRWALRKSLIGGFTWCVLEWEDVAV